MRRWLSRRVVLAMWIERRVSRRVGSSGVRSHHEVLVGDRGNLLALEVNDNGNWRDVWMWSWGISRRPRPPSLAWFSRIGGEVKELASLTNLTNPDI
jgi:hypothetical protein